MDTKLYAKILATRIKRLMPLWVDPDQTGFVPGREGRDNSIRTILMLRRKNISVYPDLLLIYDGHVTTFRTGS